MTVVSVHLTLYGTLGCHLCEQAQWLLWPLQQTDGWQLTTCDIADQPDSDVLIERYGLRLPVLRLGSAELDWPFDLERVRGWVAANQQGQQGA